MTGIDPEDLDLSDRFIEFINSFGRVLQLDDFKDIGKFDRLHHWQYGFMFEQLSVLLSVANLSRKLYNGFKEDKRQQQIHNLVNNIMWGSETCQK